MNTGTTFANESQPSRHKPRMTPAQRRVRRARNFFIIAVMAAFVSVGGHCLTGDDTPRPGDQITEASTTR